MMYDLVWVDWNAFSIMWYVWQAMKAEWARKEEIAKYREEATRSNYGNLLIVSIKMIDFLNKE